MTTLKISITPEILDKSKFCTAGTMNIMKHCAVALAVRDVFPKAIVEGDIILPFGRSGDASTIYLPKEAKRFITKFDAAIPSKRAKMKPFDFEVSIPSYVIRKINIDEIRPLLVNHPTLELVNQ